MMMHRRPSAQRAAFKYAGILPILAIVFLSFAFRDADTALTMIDMSEGGEPVRSVAAAENAGSMGNPTGDSLVRKDIAWPLFPGCADLQGQAAMACSNEQLGAYLQAELKYPDELRRKGIQGTVIVQFVVNAAGWVINPEVVQSLAPEADAAALHVIKTMNEQVGQWKPGAQDGKAIDLEMAVPFRFQTSAAQQATDPGDIDQMPVYPGCNTQPAAEREACTSNRLMQFITAQLKYPEDDRKRGIEGMGIVTFVVDTDGRLRDMRLRKSVSPGIDAEIMRIADELAKLPNPWTPAMRDGKPVAMEMTLPIAFKLSE